MSSFQHRFKEKPKLQRNGRSNILIELRKERRDDIIQKKRFEPDDKNASYVGSDIFAKYIEMCRNTDIGVRQQGIASLRNVVFQDNKSMYPIIQKFDFTKEIVNLFCPESNEQMLVDACTVLANLTMIDDVSRKNLVVDENLNIFCECLLHRSPQVVEPMIYMLANIVHDSPTCCQKLVDRNILQIIEHLLNNFQQLEINSNIGFFLVSITGRAVQNHILYPSNVETLLKIVNSLISNYSDPKVVSQGLWCLANINDYTCDVVQMSIESGILVKALSFINFDSDPKVLLAAMRVFGNIVTGNDELTQMAIDLGAFSRIVEFIAYNDEKVKRECLWFLSNVAAGTAKQCELLIDHPSVGLVLQNLRDGTYAIKKESIWVISNIIYTGPQEKIRNLVQNLNLLEYVCTELNRTKDIDMIHLCLETISFVYENCGIMWSELNAELELHGGIDMIEDLQDHGNKNINTLAANILESYFDDYFQCSDYN